MNRSLLYALVLAGSTVAVASQLVRTEAHRPGWNATHGQYTLPNGWRVSPAGRGLTLPGDMPGNILVLDGGRRALVNTCGFHDHSLNLVDLETGRIEKSVPFQKSWIGLAQLGDDALLSAGQGGGMYRLSLEGLEPRESVAVPGPTGNDRFVSNIVVGREGVYALNIQTDEVFLLDGGTAKAKAKVGYRPYGAALSPDGSMLAVSEWGNRSVALLDAKTLVLRSRVTVGAHPTALAYASDGRLFVTNAGSTSVSVIKDGVVVETIEVGVDAGRRIGPTPIALVLAPDGKRLYVANAGENCVAIVDVSKPGRARVLGFVPTERYPSAVALTPDGKRLLVGTAKGFYGPNAGSRVTTGPKARGKDYGVSFNYIGDQLTGRLTMIDLPDEAGLRSLTAQVRTNLPPGEAAVPVDRKAIEKGALKKIKHVVYVIKENRSYDQVLGDLPQGDGDSSLVIFGQRITPNAHKLVSTFSLFDNLYTDGEVSQVGHQWTDAAYANDYEEKQTFLSYGRHGEVESDRRMSSSPGDYIWSHARKKGLWARVYGEYVDVQEDHNSLQDPEIKKDPEKYGYSESFERIFARDGRDTEKVDDFLREMRDAEKTGKWPSLMVMALPEDHTHGFSAGAYTPAAMVANNDLAVGRLIDGISHSKFWKDTAVFVIQDDAQDGPDHVDSHRTVGYVLSPYVRHGAVDHTMYSTASMLRTMEIILGLSPMTEFDAKATPMHAAFTTKPDFSPFASVPAQIDVNERNPARTALAARSAKLDFSDVDRADFNELNRLLWDGYRPGIPYPGIRKRR
jgi:DNA-binding beta-propeller fold protein YncE